MENTFHPIIYWMKYYIIINIHKKSSAINVTSTLKDSTPKLIKGKK